METVDDTPTAPDAIEVTMNDLDRCAARVVREVTGGRIAVITKHGKPIALIAPLTDTQTLLPIEVDDGQLSDLSDRFAKREDRRWWSRILHGRWYNGHGINGPYKSRGLRDYT